MGERSRAPLAALAASIGLIGVYVAFGGGTYEPAKTEDPCQTRDQSVLDERGIFDRPFGARWSRLRVARQP